MPHTSLLAVGAVIAASLVAPRTTTGQESAPLRPQPSPPFRTETVCVRVGVRVLTHDGTFVSDLTRSDFELRDEGAVEQNDLKAGLDRLDDAMSSYYWLGFTPSSPTGKHFHRLAVKVHRPGVRVIARDGYLRW